MPPMTPLETLSLAVQTIMNEDKQQAEAEAEPSERAEQPAKQKASREDKPSSVPSGILRLNKLKVYGADGLPRPKPYIYERLKAVDGLTVEEACKLEFPNKHGQLQQYKRGIFYDVYNSQWLRIERSGEPAKAVADHLRVFGIVRRRTYTRGVGQALGLPPGDVIKGGGAG